MIERKRLCTNETKLIMRLSFLALTASRAAEARHRARHQSELLISDDAHLTPADSGELPCDDAIRENDESP